MFSEPLPVAQIAEPKRTSVRFWLMLAGGAGLLLFLACAGLCAGSLRLGTQSVTIASDRVDEYLKAIPEDRFEDVYEYSVSKQYRSTTSHEQHKAIGDTIESKLGKLKSKKMHSIFRGNRNGQSEITAVFNGEFEKGPGTIYTKLVWEDGSWKFEEFRIQSPALLATSKCSSCGASNSSDARFCSKCGKELGAAK